MPPALLAGQPFGPARRRARRRACPPADPVTLSPARNPVLAEAPPRVPRSCGLLRGAERPAGFQPGRAGTDRGVGSPWPTVRAGTQVKQWSSPAMPAVKYAGPESAALQVKIISDWVRE